MRLEFASQCLQMPSKRVVFVDFEKASTVMAAGLRPVLQDGQYNSSDARGVFLARYLARRYSRSAKPENNKGFLEDITGKPSFTQLRIVAGDFPSAFAASETSYVRADFTAIGLARLLICVALKQCAHVLHLPYRCARSKFLRRWKPPILDALPPCRF